MQTKHRIRRLRARINDFFPAYTNMSLWLVVGPIDFMAIAAEDESPPNYLIESRPSDEFYTLSERFPGSFRLKLELHGIRIVEADVFKPEVFAYLVDSGEMVPLKIDRGEWWG